MNNKVRIYDLAKKLKKSNKELIAVLQELGVTVKSHSSSIDEETAQAVENIIAESSSAQKKSPKTSQNPQQKQEDRFRPEQAHSDSQRQPQNQQRQQQNQGRPQNQQQRQQQNQGRPQNQQQPKNQPA